MATSLSRRATSASRLGAVLIAALAFTACADDDEPGAVPADSSVAQEDTASDVDVDPGEEGTAEVSGDQESDVDAGEEPAEPTSDPDSDEQDDDTASPITTTPPATVATGDDSSNVVDDTVPPVPPPVPGPTVVSELEEEADFGTGVSASIVDVEAVDVEGRLPGERSGPGVLVTVEVDNDSSEPISLDFVTVNLIRDDGGPALPVSSSEPSRFSGELAPGAAATARFQYFLPAEYRASATITVSYAADVPTALFSGDLPDV